MLMDWMPGYVMNYLNNLEKGKHKGAVVAISKHLKRYRTERGFDLFLIIWA